MSSRADWRAISPSPCEKRLPVGLLFPPSSPWGIDSLVLLARKDCCLSRMLPASAGAGWTASSASRPGRNFSDHYVRTLETHQDARRELNIMLYYQTFCGGPRNVPLGIWTFEGRSEKELYEG